VCDVVTFHHFKMIPDYKLHTVLFNFNQELSFLHSFTYLSTCHNCMLNKVQNMKIHTVHQSNLWQKKHWIILKHWFLFDYKRSVYRYSIKLLSYYYSTKSAKLMLLANLVEKLWLRKIGNKSYMKQLDNPTFSQNHID
jgi:hypothetical protein